jgi:hypothetical protein
MEKIRITMSQMNTMLVAVEHGYKQREKGNSIEQALASVYDLYEVAPAICNDGVYTGDRRIAG